MPKKPKINSHTQALLDEGAAPKHATRKEGENGVLALLPVLAKLSQQAAADLTLAQTAEIAEEDEELRGRFQVLVQTAEAERRICSEIEKLARDLVVTLRQRDRYNGEIRAAATEKGYPA